MRSAKPKVLQTLAGKPLLEHVLSTADSLSCEAQKLVVVGHKRQEVESWIQSVPLNAKMVVQKEQLGTGHAVKEALEYVDAERVLVLYGDVPCISEAILQDLINDVPSDAVAVLSADYDDPHGLGRIVRDEHGHVMAITEEKDASDAVRAIHEINTGIMLIPTLFLKEALPQLSNQNKQQEYYLTDIIALGRKAGRDIVAIKANDAWRTLGVNDKKQLASLEKQYQLSQAEELMKQGVQLMDPSRLDIRGTLKTGQDCTIDVNVIIEGDVVLGQGVRLGANCVIKNTTIDDNVVVEPFSHIDGAHIGPKTTIGPFARIRPQTEVGESCKIGNFVEVKNTKLQDGAKASHLTYLGDSEVGKGANIGAGTVTCNYDGVNKFKTIIKDKAFIGSGSMLVAPVTIGEDATVGAGSTITEDVPNNELAVGRTRQRLVPGWQKPKKEG